MRSDTTNNCSASVQVTVPEPEPEPEPERHPDLMVTSPYGERQRPRGWRGVHAVCDGSERR